MATQWPPVSGTDTGYKAEGVTTVRWGTDNVLQSPKPSGGFYVVLRAPQKALVENIKLPNGVGITVTRIQLIDGVQFTLTVRDDTRMTPPQVGDSLSIVDMAGMIGSSGQVITATVVENDYEAALKQAGERVLLLENLILVESQSTGSQV